jgi:HSP20 family protein
VIWNASIYDDLDEMRKDMDALSEMLGYTGAYRSSFPRLNAYEDKDAYWLAAEVPGIPRPDLDVRCDGSTLTLAGRRPGAARGREGILRQERQAGGFEKVFRFPGKVEAGAVSARLENGILMVRVPKAEEAKPKPIEIRAAAPGKGA